MDATWILDHVVYPLLGAAAGGAGGYFVAALRFGERIHVVEQAHKDAETRHQHAHAAWRIEFDSLRDDVVDARRDFLARDQMGSQADLQRASDEAREIQEDRERWEQVQRTLGKIEGYLGVEFRTATAPRPTPPLLPPMRKK